MGFWNWVVDTVTGQGPGKKHLARRDGAGGVALLDPPLHDQGEPEAEESWWAPPGDTILEPQPIQRPELLPEARALENILISHFDSHDLDMPPLPQATEKIIQSLSKPNYDVGKVADEIGEDQVITAAVLRMSNSVLYGGRDKITALKPAIARLGSNALRTLMLHQSLRAAAFQRQAGDRDLAEFVWHRSLAGACLARSLAHFTNVNAEDAFMMGLLHDIGNVIVLREVQKQQTALKYRMDLPTFEYLCSESHQEFGELVADAWKMPGELRSLISDHHSPPADDDPLRTKRLLIQLCDLIAAMIGYAPAASYDLLNTPTVHQLGLADRDDFVDFLIELPGLVELHIASVSV